METLMSDQSKTTTRSDIIEAAHAKTGLSRNDCSDVVESILKVLSKTLVGGKSVKISSFGTFDIREKAERIGRNPKTGEEVPISSRRVLVFKPSNVLKDRVNAGHAK
jgi:integration host factor subunit alpha